MRILVPLALTAALLSGCGDQSGPPPVTSGPPATATTGTTTALADPPTSPAPEPEPAGNGVDKLTAAQIVTKTKQAAKSAKTVRVKASIGSGSERVAWDMRLKGSAGGSGTLTMNGSTVQIIRIGDNAYLKGNAAFYKSNVGADAAKLFQGKYLKVRRSEKNMKELIAFTDVDEMMTMVFGDLKPSAVRKGPRKDVAGRPAITLVEPGADGGTLYVASEGKPYPLRFASPPGSTGSGSIDFLAYDAPVALKAPPAAQVVDVAKLAAGSR